MKRFPLIAFLLALCVTSFAQLQPVDVVGSDVDTPKEAMIKLNANDLYLEGLIPLNTAYWKTSGTSTLTGNTIISGGSNNIELRTTGNFLIGDNSGSGVSLFSDGTNVNYVDGNGDFMYFNGHEMIIFPQVETDFVFSNTFGAFSFQQKIKATTNTTYAGINVGAFALTPSDAENGDIWYDPVNHNFLIYSNSATRFLIDNNRAQTISGAKTFTTAPIFTFGSDIQGAIYQRGLGGAIQQLASVATGNVLISGGVGSLNSWGKIGLTTHVSGTLPVANGGTGRTDGTPAFFNSAITSASMMIANGTSGEIATLDDVSYNLGTNTLTVPVIRYTGDPDFPHLTLDPQDLLGTTVPGAVENDGEHLYYTDENGDRFQLDQQDGSELDSDLTTIAGLSPSNDDVMQFKSGAWTNRTLAQVRTDLALVEDNITDGATTTASSENALFDALALKANLASPTFSGTPSLPTGTTGVTQSAGNSTTALATTAFVTTADNLKANLASPTFTGTVVLPSTTSIGTVSSTEIGYVDGASSNIQGQIDDLVAAVVSNVYNPTGTGEVNVASTENSTANYSRVGNMVYVYGIIEVTPSASGATQLRLTLPIAENISGTLAHLLGMGTASESSSMGLVRVDQDATNDAATLVFTAFSTSEHTIKYNFSYRIGTGEWPE